MDVHGVHFDGRAGVGFRLPRLSRRRSRAGYGTEEALRPGTDLVFFAQTAALSARVPVMQLGVIANFDKPSAVSALREVDRLAVKLGIQLVCSPTHKPHLPSALVTDEDRVAGRAGMIMVLGGDGTMLSAARSLQECDIPLIGVNLGKLGFMTSVALDQLEDAFARLARREYSLSTRSMLACTVGAREFLAVNDVVLG